MFKLKKQFRLFGYDYSQNGHYFVTFNTKNRLPFFGKIENKQIQYSDIGNYVKSNIEKLYINYDLANPFELNPYFLNDKYNFIIGIDDWTIMPDHIHLIVLIINNNKSIQEPITKLSALRKGSLGNFINHFKGNITNFANKNKIEFEWQSRFNDRIIRDENEYQNVKNYIQNNVWNFKL